MTDPDHALRARVATELDALAAHDGPLASTGNRATINQAVLFGRGGLPTSQRQRLHRELITRYLAQQSNVPRRGKAALLTAGPPGAGKSAAVEATTDVTGWRRLDADIIKTYLIEEALRSRRYDDLLARTNTASVDQYGLETSHPDKSDLEPSTC